MNGNDRIVDWINGLGAKGVSHVQVRFAARSASGTTTTKVAPVSGAREVRSEQEGDIREAGYPGRAGARSM